MRVVPCMAAVLLALIAMQARADDPVPLVGYGDVALGEPVGELRQTHSIVKICCQGGSTIYVDAERQHIAGKEFTVTYLVEGGTVRLIALRADYLTGDMARCMGGLDTLAELLARKYGKFDGRPEMTTDHPGVVGLKAIKSWSDRRLDVRADYDPKAGLDCVLFASYRFNDAVLLLSD